MQDILKKYAGIGSRKTPDDILQIMQQLAVDYAKKKYLLCSGNCKGADQAFQRGANIINPKLVELFLPNESYNKKDQEKGNRIVCDKKYFKEALKIASRIYLRWNQLSKMGKTFHGRSVQMILGRDLTSPVDFVICWTPEAKEIGGTSIGIILARERSIPLFNLAKKDQLDQLLRSNIIN